MRTKKFYERREGGITPPDARVRAFTLVELLVVIAIIGILIAMLLPAVQAAREAARRISCSNKLRQVSVAAQIYHSTHNHLPYGYVGDPNYKIGDPMTTRETRWPWIARLFPNLELTSLYEQINWDTCLYRNAVRYYTDILFTQYSTLQCPSESTVQNGWSGWDIPRGDMARVSYVGNFGQSNPNVPNSAGMEMPGHIKGVFARNYGASYDEIGDGTSNTLLASEIIPGDALCVRGLWWAEEGVYFQQEYPPNDQTPDVVRIGRCGDQAVNMAAKAPCDGSLPFNHYYVNVHTARSAHPGGVNVTMCDASVSFVSNDIDLAVWRAMGTPNGGEVFEKP